MRPLSILTAAGTAHSNSTDEAVLASHVFAAYTFAAGKVYRVTGSVRATSTNSTDTLTAVLRLGAVALTGTALATTGAVDATNNDVFSFDVEIVPRADGASVAVRGTASILGAAGTVTHRAVHAIVSSLDFEAALSVAVTADWSVASASNSVQAETFNVYEVA
jgi:hypothetical protein